jgi:hypothetical protein
MRSVWLSAGKHKAKLVNTTLRRLVAKPHSAQPKQRPTHRNSGNGMTRKKYMVRRHSKPLI